MALSYILIYLAVHNGVRSTGKVVYLTALLPYVLLALLLVRGLLLDGAIDGLKYLLVPDWSVLYEFKVWRDAIVQIIFSSGIGVGPLIFYSSCRPKTEKIMKSATWIPVIDAATALFASVVLFCFIGYISKQLGISINDIPINGIELAFVAYP